MGTLPSCYYSSRDPRDIITRNVHQIANSHRTIAEYSVFATLLKSNNQNGSFNFEISQVEEVLTLHRNKISEAQENIEKALHGK